MDSRLLANAPEHMGEAYERGMIPIVFGPWAALLIERVKPQPGERVLDVACGTGAVTRLAAECVGPSGMVIGADVSPPMLAAARHATARLPIEWREADAAALPFADDSFDLVLCQQGLQFFPDRLAALREMRRVLVADGRLALAVWARQEENPAPHALGMVLAKHVGPQAGRLPPYALGDADTVRGLAADAGFHDIDLRQETLLIRWPSVEEMLNRQAAGPMMAALTAMSADERRALVDEMESMLTDYIGNEGLVVPQASNLLFARP